MRKKAPDWEPFLLSVYVFGQPTEHHVGKNAVLRGYGDDHLFGLTGVVQRLRTAGRTNYLPQQTPELRETTRADDARRYPY